MVKYYYKDYTRTIMDVTEKKIDNKYLLEKQLETLKLFYERKLLTKEQYEFEVKTLTTKIKTDNK